ncbi:COG2426 family protein [Paraclostridium sordellii]|uniref:Membrane protein n=1 Tax=Paraclostridium sordellii TaxID=1505 RepID=A0A0C7QW41_PARSO|nr:small multi-drug export protein [Paeniclostridium sordellii]QYE97365.1 small multi-drug export protein [Paeniclostridium sordellii]CEN21645.1 membrane protein [[Clostridium] sordellii] [Paeniclostridium sordellii]CEN21891.1 membrane protein [[Clostridium] sordellii] [Paeniclostridium sordellii]CEP88048.1 membrane protein [[Clostridium] sordellii] [Paeniclostridium sordellii]CEP97217.1 membrane protein [[Clostridium] sordellii] [Paeniclostridium sordellii]
MGYIKLMFLSMVPVIELRGAIPLGIAMDLNPIYVYISCVIGSTIIGIPVVLLFRKFIEILRHRKYFNQVIKWIDIKIEGRAKKLKAASVIGIILFVGIPLPTTGSWSAAALASILKMRIKNAIFGIFIGNCISGIIILTISNHLLYSISIKKTLIFTLVILVIIIGYILAKKRKNKINQ